MISIIRKTYSNETYLPNQLQNLPEPSYSPLCLGEKQIFKKMLLWVEEFVISFCLGVGDKNLGAFYLSWHD